ncbi:MAG: hypothetical protein WAL02_05185, partial [Rhodoplanes sp.]
GISGLTGPEDTPAGLLKRADEALSRAQRDGRNRGVIPDTEGWASQTPAGLVPFISLVGEGLRIHRAVKIC